MRKSGAVEPSPEAPRATAGELTLPGGEQVWVQTLNAFHRDEMRPACAAYAQRASARLGANGDMRRVTEDILRDEGADVQVSLLVNWSFANGDVLATLDAELPPLPQPERGDLTDEAWLDALDAWTAAVEDREKQRDARSTELRKEQTEFFAGMDEAERLERCIAARRSMEFSEAFMRRYKIGTWYRAVRRADNHLQLYFGSEDEVANLPGDAMAAIERRYNELDTVAAAEVPT